MSIQIRRISCLEREISGENICGEMSIVRKIRFIRRRYRRRPEREK